MVEQRLVELGLSLKEIKEMSVPDVIDWYTLLSHFDKRQAEKKSKEWSKLGIQ
jgi:hypothetical protein